MHESVLGRPGRREGVGLVQEAANGDTGHSYCLCELFAGDVRLVIAGCASDEAIQFCMPHGRPVIASAKCGVLRHSGMREAQTRNLEIPGSMLRIAPE
jgi:hypothetical protein